MRTIELSKVDSFDEREQLITLLKGAPAQGYSIDQVRNALKVIERLGAVGPLTLENAEHEFLVAHLKSQRWLVASPEIVAMFDKIVNAPAINPT